MTQQQSTQKPKGQPSKKKVPNFWDRYKSGVQAEADAKSGSQPTDETSDELNEEEREMIARRREQKNTQERMRTESDGKGAKKPVFFKRYEVNKVFVIGHHWSWVIFKDFPFWLISFGSLIVTIVLPFFPDFEASVQYFMLLVILPVVIWWRTQFWKKDCWEMDLGNGSLRDITVPWHLLSKNSRVAGGTAGLANWEVIQPMVAWNIGRIGHLEFQAVAGKENALEGIKFPDIIDKMLSSWRSGKSFEEIEALYNEWKAKKTPIERLVGWFFGLFHSGSKTKHTTAQRPVQKKKQKVEQVQRLEKEPEGRIIELDTRTSVTWRMFYDQPEKPVTPCGLRGCKEYVGGRIDGSPITGISIDLPDGRKYIYFHSLQHLNEAIRRLRRQRDPQLERVKYSKELFFDEN